MDEQHVGRSVGFERTPLFTSDFSKLHILSILPFESGPLVSLLLKITAVQTSLVVATVPGYAGSFMGDQRGTRANLFTQLQ